MTLDKTYIWAIEPGRKLDILVARDVMGLYLMPVVGRVEPVVLSDKDSCESQIYSFLGGR